MPTFTTGVLLSLTAALAWGTGMVSFKVGVKNVDTLAATYIKGLVAVPLLLILGLTINGTETYTKLLLYPNYIWLILGGLSITLGDFFSLFALQKIDVSISQPITAIYPIFTTPSTPFWGCFLSLTVLDSIPKAFNVQTSPISKNQG